MGEVVVTGGGYEELRHGLDQGQRVKVSGRLGLTLVPVLSETSDY
jgi:hypothetical protein